MTRICVVLLIGIPGCGKTALAQHLATHLRSSSMGVIHLCFDKLFPLNTEAIELGAFKVSRNQYLTLTEALISYIRYETPMTKEFKDFTIECNDKQDIILLMDDNNYYRSMRYKFYQLAKQYELSFVQIMIKCDVIEACNRDGQRANPVGETIIRQMALKFEPPNRINKWEVNTLIVDQNYDDNLLKFFIITALDRPLSGKQEVDLSPVEQSDIHKLDLALRKLVSSLVLKAKDKRNASTVLNIRRKQILDDVRNGVIPLLNADEYKQMLDISPQP